jgi:hypothetical protein
MTDLESLAPYMTAVGLNLPENLEFDDWLEVGRRLARTETGLQWAIGDWWVHGEWKYGERKAVAEKLEIYKPGTLANFGRVARAFQPTSRRREDLSFSHHAAAASLGDDAAVDRLLLWAAEPLQHGEKRRSVYAVEQEVFAIKKAREDENTARALADRRRGAGGPGEAAIGDVLRRLNEASRIINAPSPRPAKDPEPAIKLDQSAASAPVSDALRNLEVEPSPPVDRVAIAKAAIDALSFDEVTEVFSDWATAPQQTNDSEDGVDKYSWPCIPKDLKEVSLNKEQEKTIKMVFKHFINRRSQRILIMMLEGIWTWMTPNAEHPERRRSERN